MRSWRWSARWERVDGVHRLWEPHADKQRPANGYGGKYSTPYCIAAAIVRANVGLGDFTDAAVKDPAVRAVAA